MFGQPPKHLRELATRLALMCPPWNARVVQFGPEMAVVCDGSEYVRDVYLVRDGRWQCLTVFTDDDGEGHQLGPIQPLGLSTNEVPALAQRIHDVTTTAYRNATTYKDGEEDNGVMDVVFISTREAARQCLPHLAAGGR